MILLDELEVHTDHLDLACGYAGSPAGARDVGDPGGLRGRVAAREADEGLTGLQVGHELGRCRRLDAVVRGDAVPAVHLPAAVGELGVGTGLVARPALLGHRVVVLEGGRRVIALDRAARGRVVAGRGEGESISPVVAQWDDRL